MTAVPKRPRGLRQTYCSVLQPLTLPPRTKPNLALDLKCDVTLGFRPSIRVHISAEPTAFEAPPLGCLSF